MPTSAQQRLQSALQKQQQSAAILKAAMKKAAQAAQQAAQTMGGGGYGNYEISEHDAGGGGMVVQPSGSNYQRVHTPAATWPWHAMQPPQSGSSMADPVTSGGGGYGNYQINDDTTPVVVPPTTQPVQTGSSMAEPVTNGGGGTMPPSEPAQGDDVAVSSGGDASAGEYEPEGGGGGKKADLPGGYGGNYGGTGPEIIINPTVPVVVPQTETPPQKTSSVWGWVAVIGLAVTAIGVGYAMASGSKRNPACPCEFRKERERYWIGKRVQLPPWTDQWMRGDRYGEVTGVTPKGDLRVKMDKSRRVVVFKYGDVSEVF